MSEYTVKYINRRARTDAAGFIRDCEEHYHRQIHMAADEIVQELGPEGGHARFSYVLDSGNEELISRNLVQVTVTPVR